MYKSLYQFAGGKIVGWVLMGVGSIAARSTLGQPAAPSEADQIREELRAVKQEYETRMRALEERLRRLAASSRTVVTNVVTVPTPTVTNLTPVPTTAVTAAPSTNAVVRARQFAEEEFQRDT